MKWIKKNHDFVIWFPITFITFIALTFTMKVVGLKVYDPGILQGLLIGSVKFSLIMTLAGWWMRIIFPKLFNLIVDKESDIEGWQKLVPYQKLVLSVALYLGLGLVAAIAFLV